MSSSHTKETSSSHFQSESDVVEAVAASFGIGDQGVGYIRSTLSLIGMLNPTLGQVEAVTISVVSAFLSRSGIPEAARMAFVSEVSKHPAEVIATDSVSIFDGVIMVITTPGGIKCFNTSSMKEVREPSGAPFVLTVFNLARFHDSVRSFYDKHEMPGVRGDDQRGSRHDPGTRQGVRTKA